MPFISKLTAAKPRFLLKRYVGAQTRQLKSQRIGHTTTLSPTIMVQKFCPLRSCNFERGEEWCISLHLPHHGWGSVHICTCALRGSVSLEQSSNGASGNWKALFFILPPLIRTCKNCMTRTSSRSTTMWARPLKTVALTPNFTKMWSLEQ